MLVEDKFPQGKTNILKFSDQPVVQSIKAYFKKNYKQDKVQLVYINENGDVWEMGIRFTIPVDSPQYQQQRDMAKSKAYDMKQGLNAELMATYNIPNMSIQAVKLVGEDLVEFGISFIYANKGNIKYTFESMDPRIQSIIKEAEQPVVATTSLLNEEIGKWEILDKQITEHQKDFEKMIATKLADREALRTKVFGMLEDLKIKNHQVGEVVIKMKDATTRTNVPYKEIWTEALSKVNAATKAVLLNLQETLTTTSPVKATRNMSREIPAVKEEGVSDTIGQGLSWLKDKVIALYQSIKGYNQTVKNFLEVVSEPLPGDIFYNNFNGERDINADVHEALENLDEGLQDVEDIKSAIRQSINRINENIASAEFSNVDIAKKKILGAQMSAKLIIDRLEDWKNNLA